MHSFRRDGAFFYFKSGIPGEIVQLFGNWASDCYIRYLRFTRESFLMLPLLFPVAFLKLIWQFVWRVRGCAPSFDMYLYVPRLICTVMLAASIF